MFDRTRAHNALPLLPPGVDVETPAVLRATTRASRALAELKGVGGLIPDQTMLVRTLALQEARLSSEIENVFTTSDELYRQFGDDPDASSGPAKEVLRYSHAVWSGVEHIRSGRPLDRDLFSRLVAEVKQRPMELRSRPGTTIGNPALGRIVYTPPDDRATIKRLLENLADYYRADEPDGPDPLVRMAVAHYQFEAIHPFSDGNGRTGRILNLLHLMERRLLDQPVLYLSGAILRTKGEYARLLREVTEQGAWEPWIVYVLRSVERTARETVARVTAIRAALDAAKETARAELGRAFDAEAVELVFEMPYTRVARATERLDLHRQTATGRLRALETAGIVRVETKGRELYFVNDALMALLQPDDEE